MSERHALCDPRIMDVYPDGDALSEWEQEILEDMEREFGLTEARLVALLGQDAVPLYLLAAQLVATEAAVALAITVSWAGTLAGLATIGSSLWVTSVCAAQGLRYRPGRPVSARF
jgi:hypothetical protein